jgi:hypothetical protein
VYFGYVDQRDDDHRLIRGHTVSATHQDKKTSYYDIRLLYSSWHCWLLQSLQ